MTDLPQITDSHCHLDFPDFDGQIEDILARAASAGVTRMVTICTKLRNLPTVRAIAEAHAPIYFAAGTHPMSAADEPMATVEELVSIAAHPKMVGIGENRSRTTTTPQKAKSFSSNPCAFTSKPHAKLACLLSSTAATPTKIWRAFCLRSIQQAHSVA